MSVSRVCRSFVVAAALVVTSGLVVPAASAAEVVPADPTNANVALTTGGIAVSWVDNAQDEVGFIIERSWGDQGFGVIGAVGADVSSFIDTAYWISGFTYRVRAHNDRGFSAYATSRTISLVSTNTGIAVAPPTAQPPNGTAPMTVTLSTAFPVLSNTTVTWHFGDGTSVTTTATDPVSTVTHTYASFATFAVTAVVTATGEFGSARGGASTLVTVGAPALKAPSDLTATSRTKRTVALTWSNPLSDANEILIFRCPTRRCSSPAIITSLGASATSFTDTQVKSGTTYDYWLIVRNAAGETAGSQAVSVKVR